MRSTAKSEARQLPGNLEATGAGEKQAYQDRLKVHIEEWERRIQELVAHARQAEEDLRERLSSEESGQRPERGSRRRVGVRASRRRSDAARRPHTGNRRPDGDGQVSPVLHSRVAPVWALRPSCWVPRQRGEQPTSDPARPPRVSTSHHWVHAIRQRVEDPNRQLRGADPSFG